MVFLRPGPPRADDQRPANGADEGSRVWAIEDVLDAALTTTEAEVAEIFLREDSRPGVSLVGFRGPFPDAFNQIKHFEEGQGYPGIVAWNGRPLRVTDAPHDGRFLRTRVKELGFRYFLCVPIPGADRPLGSLDVAWREGSEASLTHCLTLTRDAERLGLMLAREHYPGAFESGAAEAPDADRTLELRLLGGFEARRGGAPLTIDSFVRRRAVTLLKILVTNYGKVVVRDELIELLWPSDPPKDAGSLLKTAVHYLRRGLGETDSRNTETSFIWTEPNGYRFNPGSPHRLDAIEFEKLAAEGFHFERRGRWREALVALRAAADIYRGDYLQDDPYSDWSQRRRRQLRDTLLDVLLTTGRLLRSAGDTEAAIRCYRRTLQFDPCLEDVHRDLMDALFRTGRRTQALRQFEACREALRDEFDAAPVMETEALYRSILGRVIGEHRA